MKKLILIAVFLALPLSVFSHPGRTASDGCHYCRTNCGSWGVPYGVRHCHGGRLKHSHPELSYQNDSHNSFMEHDHNSPQYDKSHRTVMNTENHKNNDSKREALENR